MIEVTNLLTVTFSVSKKGHRALWRAGYRHLMNKVNKNDSSIWKCTYRKCWGSVTWSEVEEKVLRVSEHICDPDFNAYRRELFLCQLREEVCQSTKSIQKVFEDVLQQYQSKPEYVKCLPTYDKVKASLFSARKKYLSTRYVSC